MSHSCSTILSSLSYNHPVASLDSKLKGVSQGGKSDIASTRRPFYCFLSALPSSAIYMCIIGPEGKTLYCK